MSSNFMVSTNIRVPEDIWEAFKDIAYKEERSINGQLITVLKSFVEDYNKIRNKNNDYN